MIHLGLEPRKICKDRQTRDERGKASSGCLMVQVLVTGVTGAVELPPAHQAREVDA